MKEDGLGTAAAAVSVVRMDVLACRLQVQITTGSDCAVACSQPPWVSSAAAQVPALDLHFLRRRAAGRGGLLGGTTPAFAFAVNRAAPAFAAILRLRGRRHGLHETVPRGRPLGHADRVDGVHVCRQRFEGVQHWRQRPACDGPARVAPVRSVVTQNQEFQVVATIVDFRRVHDVHHIAEALCELHVGSHLPQRQVGAIHKERMDPGLHGEPHTRLVPDGVGLELVPLELVARAVRPKLFEEVARGTHVREPRRELLARFNAVVVGQLAHRIVRLPNAREAPQDKHLPREAWARGHFRRVAHHPKARACRLLSQSFFAKYNLCELRDARIPTLPGGRGDRCSVWEVVVAVVADSDCGAWGARVCLRRLRRDLRLDSAELRLHIGRTQLRLNAQRCLAELLFDATRGRRLCRGVGLRSCAATCCTDFLLDNANPWPRVRRALRRRPRLVVRRRLFFELCLDSRKIRPRAKLVPEDLKKIVVAAQNTDGALGVHCS
mmetsp:Transcript_62419/g.174048  ORF Transcript_62419/g.174048 Transcript_62419/m.174048 type:complete len:494 (-) Transcript_62419:972-2453(-)